MGENGIYAYFRTFDYTTVDEWKAHLAELYASGNPLVIAYELVTATETPFTDEEKAVGSKYQAWKNGTEKVIENREDNLEINNTLIQKYVLVS